MTRTSTLSFVSDSLESDYRTSLPGRVGPRAGPCQCSSYDGALAGCMDVREPSLTGPPTSAQAKPFFMA